LLFNVQTPRASTAELEREELWRAELKFKLELMGVDAKYAREIAAEIARLEAFEKDLKGREFVVDVDGKYVVVNNLDPDKIASLAYGFYFSV
jgi:hypothetical protein